MSHRTNTLRLARGNSARPFTGTALDVTLRACDRNRLPTRTPPNLGGALIDSEEVDSSLDPDLSRVGGLLWLRQPAPCSQPPLGRHLYPPVPGVSRGVGLTLRRC